MGQSKTSKYYANNPEAAEKRREYQRKLNKTKKQKDYRVDHAKARVALGLKKGDGMDASKKKDGTYCAESRSKNRKRNGANGKSTKK